MELFFLPLFVSFAFWMLHIKNGVLHILLQVTQTKAEKDIIGESLKDDDIIETKDDKGSTSK